MKPKHNPRTLTQRMIVLVSLAAGCEGESFIIQDYKDLIDESLMKSVRMPVLHSASMELVSTMRKHVRKAAPTIVRMANATAMKRHAVPTNVLMTLPTE